MTEVKRCALCGVESALHSHHVVGRVGPNKDNPENKIWLCWKCHYEWHNTRTFLMELRVYKIMKQRYGEAFPILVNGKPYNTKWIMKCQKHLEEK